MMTFTFGRSKICGLTAALLCMTATTSVAADCSRFSGARPAQLVNSEQNLEVISELVPSWKTDESVRLIKLAGFINRAGRIETPCCTSSTHKMSAGAIRLVTKRMDRLIFKPASHNGEALRVSVGFSIIAKKSPDGVVIDLLMNRLNSMDKFGTNYLAPQRIWTQGMRSEGRRAGGRVFLEVQATVNSSGQAADAKVITQTQNAAASSGITAARVESACYVPGYYDGKPVEMVYSELFENL